MAFETGPSPSVARTFSRIDSGPDSGPDSARAFGCWVKVARTPPLLASNVGAGRPAAAQALVIFSMPRPHASM